MVKGDFGLELDNIRPTIRGWTIRDIIGLLFGVGIIFFPIIGYLAVFTNFENIGLIFLFSGIYFLPVILAGIFVKKN